MPKFEGKDLYQIKVTLIGSKKPPVWRRVIIPKSITLDKLHQVIQDAMGWFKCHLYTFKKGNTEYLESEKFEPYNDSPNTVECKGFPLTNLLVNEGDKLKYTYDMGDCWEHKIVLEKSSLPDQELAHVPICIKGNGDCPCEDSGGIEGWYERLEEIKDVNNPEREMLHDWFDAEADIRKFDLEMINGNLANPFDMSNFFG